MKNAFLFATQQLSRNPLRYVALHRITAAHCLLLFALPTGDLLDSVKLCPKAFLYIAQNNINQVLIQHDRAVPWVEDDSLNLIYL